VYNELTTKSSIPIIRGIYRVLTLSKEGDKIPKISDVLPPGTKTIEDGLSIRSNLPLISYDSEDSPLHLESGGEKLKREDAGQTVTFLKFSEAFRFMEGSSKSALDKPDNIILSEKPQKNCLEINQQLGR